MMPGMTTQMPLITTKYNQKYIGSGREWIHPALPITVHYDANAMKPASSQSLKLR